MKRPSTIKIEPVESDFFIGPDAVTERLWLHVRGIGPVKLLKTVWWAKKAKPKK